MAHAWLLLKNVVFTVFVPGFLGVWVPLRYVARDAALPAVWAASHCGAAALIAAGAAIYAWCVWDFATVGRGTPAPIAPPRVLVVRGLYRHVRNPMYLGVLSVAFGEAWFLGSWAVARYALAGAVMFHGVVLFIEEPVLRTKFGESYARYCLAVRRWLPGRAWRG